MSNLFRVPKTIQAVGVLLRHPGVECTNYLRLLRLQDLQFDLRDRLRRKPSRKSTCNPLSRKELFGVRVGVRKIVINPPAQRKPN